MLTFIKFAQTRALTSFVILTSCKIKSAVPVQAINSNHAAASLGSQNV